MKNDLNLSRLVSSRICHDLIGSASSALFAIEELEHMEEVSSKETPEGINLAKRSAKLIVSRISFFRMAFGNASIGDGPAGIMRAKKLVNELFSEKNINVSWSSTEDSKLLQAASSENLKLLLNVFLLGFYCIPNSVELKLFIADIGENVGFAIEIKGKGVRMDLSTISATKLSLEESELNANNIQGYFSGLLAKELNAQLEIRDNAQGEIQIAVSLPKVDKSVYQLYQQSSKTED